MCMPYHPEEFGTNVARIMNEKGMSAQDLAAKVEAITADEIASWEAEGDCPDIQTINEICMVLGTEYKVLLAQ